MMYDLIVTQDIIAELGLSILSYNIIMDNINRSGSLTDSLYCPHYEEYLISDRIKVPDYEVIMDENNVLSVDFDPAANEKLESFTMNKNFDTLVHDYTFEEICNETDVRFDAVFPALQDGYDDLSPDFLRKVNEKLFFVMEFTTRDTDNMLSLERAFKEKESKYKQAIKNRAIHLNATIHYYVIVVGQRRIVTNLLLSEYQCSGIVQRFRTALSINDTCIAKNFYLSNNKDVDLSDRVKDMRNTLSSIKFNWTQTSSFNLKEFYDDVVNSPCDLNYLRDKLKSEMEKSYEDVFRESRIDVPTLEKRISLNLENCEQAYYKYWKDFDSSRSEYSESMKAIIPIPYICVPYDENPTTNVGKDNDDLDYIGTSNESTFRVWESAIFYINSKLDDFNNEDIDKLEQNAMITVPPNFKEETNDFKSHYRRVRVGLDMNTRIDIAMQGVQAKTMSFHSELLTSKLKKKLTYDSSISTHDINDFLRYAPDEFVKFSSGNDEVFKPRLKEMVEIIGDSMNLHRPLDQKNKLPLSDMMGSEMTDFLENHLETDLGHWAAMVSDIGSELAISLRQNVKTDQFIVKRLKHFPVYLLIKPTNSSSHVFFSMLVHKDRITNDLSSESLFRNTTFRQMYSNDKVYWTEFLSFNVSKLTNIIKFESTCYAQLCYWLSFYDIPYFSKDYLEKAQKMNIKKSFSMLALSLMINIHDKTKVEEVITLSRFTMMEGFVSQPMLPNPQKMVTKLPTYARSRLTIWLLKKHEISSKRICRMNGFMVDSESEEMKWGNLFNFFTLNSLSSPFEVINLFYLGYLKNKEETPENNVTADLYEKILLYEDKKTKI